MGSAGSRLGAAGLMWLPPFVGSGLARRPRVRSSPRAKWCPSRAVAFRRCLVAGAVDLRVRGAAGRTLIAVLNSGKPQGQACNEDRNETRRRMTTVDRLGDACRRDGHGCLAPRPGPRPRTGPTGGWDLWSYPGARLSASKPRPGSDPSHRLSTDTDTARVSALPPGHHALPIQQARYRLDHQPSWQHWLGHRCQRRATGGRVGHGSP